MSRKQGRDVSAEADRAKLEKKEAKKEQNQNREKDFFQTSGIKVTEVYGPGQEVEIRAEGQPKKRQPGNTRMEQENRDRRSVNVERNSGTGTGRYNGKPGNQNRTGNTGKNVTGMGRPGKSSMGNIRKNGNHTVSGGNTGNIRKAVPEKMQANDRNQKPVAKQAARQQQIMKQAGTQKQTQFRVTPENGKTVKIIPLGGLGQIGMNITAIECGNDIIVVDGGMAFPEDDMLGIDLVIPDITYLKDNADKIRGMVITHGHEDHIGAIPYIEKEIKIPLYATRLTMGLIEYKLTEHNIIDSVPRKVVSYGDVVKLGCFRVEFIRTNHSISDSAALAIYTPAGTIVHTGDFKVDFTPVFGDTIDLQRFGELGRQGVLALMMDSTNVERPGYTPSEKTVGKTFDHIFDDNRDHRLIIATFASNVDRVQQIINSAYKYGRKVIVDGRSMVNVISIAQELGYIHVPDNTLIDIDEGKNYPDEKLVYVTTGSQGENMAALSRIAANIHQKISITPNDVVVFSSNPIPGNEKSVSNVVNELEQEGARVIWHDVHVSGHACQEELKLIYALTKPKYAIPVHGEYRHLKRHAELAHEMGIPEKNIVILKCGDVLEVGQKTFKKVGTVPASGVLVDGRGVGDVGNVVLRDRQMLSENGIVIVSLTVDAASGDILSGPDIITRGFVYVREAESLIEECRDVVEETLDTCRRKNIRDWAKIRNNIRDSLSGFLWRKTMRSPMILPVISQID